MKKYLLNRIVRSLFSIIMVMILSVVLIFSLVPESYIISKSTDIATAYKSGTDAGTKETLKVLEKHGYIDYVTQQDFCLEKYGDSGSEKYKTCVARLDSNEDKQEYLKKYRDLGWTEIKLIQEVKDNATNVTREAVESGKYTKSEDQYYIPDEGSPDDELYEQYVDNGEVKQRVVTYNNVTYFRKNINPLKTFWKWFTGLITFDHMNKLDNVVQWDRETQTYLTENPVYDFVFSYTKGIKEYEEPYQYTIKDTDIDLTQNIVNITGENAGKYISVGGISTNVVADSKIVSNITTTKTFNNEDDHQEGGKLSIVVTFDDSTSVTIEKEVSSFLDNDIPVYVGDDNRWYIGNTCAKINYKDIEFDWDLGGEVEIVKNIKSITFSESAVERGYSIKLDEYGAPALTCVGCEHKYLVYFDNTFPYIHFNFIELNLGESITGTTEGKDVTEILTDRQGGNVYSETVFPSGEVIESESKDFHTCTYQGNTLSIEQLKLYNDNYANCLGIQEESSMIATSFLIGIIATMIAYFIGVPVGVMMARNKDRWFDRLGMVYIIIMFSVPSLAYIFFFSSIGTNVFNLPATYKYGQVTTYILPIVSLSLGSIASMMMWTRRYIIDQGNSDYVKFARAKGLSEGQIFFKHILRNAIVPIAHGIPGSIVGSVAGALITEQIYGVPGTGKLMVDSINNNDNWVAIGLIFFFTFIGIFSIIMGDVVITLVDPRISFVDTGGRK